MIIFYEKNMTLAVNCSLKLFFGSKKATVKAAFLVTTFSNHYLLASAFTTLITIPLERPVALA